jgi:hypothetical protein
MTTKEIAEATGKDVSTVQRWIKKMNGKMQSIDSKMQSSNSTNPADFNLEETIFIIEYGMGKNAAALYRMSAKDGHVQNDDVSRQNDYVTKSDMAEFGKSLVSEIFKQMMPLIQVNTKPVYQIEAPQIDLRAQLRQVMNTAARVSGDYSGAWNMLYNEIYYRLHINVKERAKNADCKPLDILEAENQLNNAILIAREIFK